MIAAAGAVADVQLRRVGERVLQQRAQRLFAGQNAVVRRLTAAIPAAQVRWRYRLVLDGFAVTLPRSQLAELARVPGVAKVWPNVRYHSLAAAATPDQIGAPALWGPGL